MRLRTAINLPTSTNQTMYITVNVTTGTTVHFGFKIVNNQIFGSCSDGTTQSLTAAIVTFSDNASFALKAKLITGSKVEFTVIEALNGTEYTGELTTNLPTGQVTSAVMNIYIAPQEAVAKKLIVGFWDVWNGI